MGGTRLPDNLLRKRPDIKRDDDSPLRPQTSSWLRIAVLFTTGTIILGLPAHFSGSDTFHPRFPLEILWLTLAALLVPRTLYPIFRLATTACLLLILFLKLADIGTDLAFQRPFNPYLDFKLMLDGWDLLSRSIGRLHAIVLVVASLVVWLLTGLSLLWSLGGFRTLSRFGTRALGASTVVGLLIGTFMLTAPVSMPLSAGIVTYVTNRASTIQGSINDLVRFEQELESDPLGDLPFRKHFSYLAGMDVIFIFIESYGRSAVENPAFASTIQARLREMEQKVSSAGLKARSGWLTSPTVAGLSWLAHGTLLSGLWTNNQARYDRMITSHRPSLNALFQRAGWQTVAVMPAITREWPESSYFGYDTIRNATGLGYRGKPFNWVTMPDQYTLSAFERLHRGAGHSPVMAEIALISSHAPWTPVPTLVDWTNVADGRIFDDQAISGDPPSVVWSDPDRVRSQYCASIDYVLQVLSSYIPRFGRNTLFLLLGDHQPAGLVTGDSASRDVPIHIIGPPVLLKRIAHFEWTEGMIPASDLPSLRMDRLRERFVRAFSGGRSAKPTQIFP